MLTGDTGDSPPNELRIECDCEEALDVAVLHWAQLPAPASIRCVDENGRFIWLTASRNRAQEARAARIPCFAPVEYEALFAARLAGRATKADLERWCDLRGAGVPLSPRAAFGGADGLLTAPAQYGRRWDVVDDQGRTRPELLEGVTMRRAIAACGWGPLNVVVEKTSAETAQTEEVDFAQL